MLEQEFLAPRALYTPSGQVVRKNFEPLSVPFFQNQSYALMDIKDQETSKQYTLKLIFKEKISKDAAISEINNQRKFIHHSCIVALNQVYEDDNYIYLLMEKTGKNLGDILQERGHLSEREVQYIFCHLVEILQTLRKKNIFHGNICLENLYLYHSSQAIELRLNGFGNSINMEKIREKDTQTANSSIQPNLYSSPQMLITNVDNFQMYYASDIWSVGVVIFNLLVGQQPFSTNHNGIVAASINKIKNCSYFFPKDISISTPWKELIKKIFQPFCCRMTLNRLIQHKFNNITESMFKSIDIAHAPLLANNWIISTDFNIEYDFSLNFEKKVTQKIEPFLHQSRPTFTSDKKYHTSWCQNIFQQKHPKIKPIHLRKLNSEPIHKSYKQQMEISKDFITISEMSNKTYEFVTDFHSELMISDFIIDENPTKVGENNMDKIYAFHEYKNSEISQPSAFRKTIKSTKKSHSLSKTLSQNIALNKEPSYIQNYCYIKQYECLGYLFNNKICVLFSDSSTIFGANKSQFQYYSSLKRQGKFLKYQRSSDRSPEQCFPEENMEYPADINLNRVSFFDQSQVSSNLSKEKLKIYQYFVEFYGNRVIKSEMSLYIIKFWRIQSAFVFLYNNGVWQINLGLGKKGQGAVLIDQSNLGWWLGPDGSKYNPLCVKIGRYLVNKIRQDQKEARNQ